MYYINMYRDNNYTFDDMCDFVTGIGKCGIEDVVMDVKEKKKKGGEKLHKELIELFDGSGEFYGVVKVGLNDTTHSIVDMKYVENPKDYIYMLDLSMTEEWLSLLRREFYLGENNCDAENWLDFYNDQIVGIAKRIGMNNVR